MHLIIAGCEYSGSTTLASAFGRWAIEATSDGDFGPNQFHDHWKLPHISNFSPPAAEDVPGIVAAYPDARDGDYTRTGLTGDEQAQIMALSPKLKEMVQRYHLQYHLHPSFYRQLDHIMVGAHLDEGIIAPLYFEYGGEGKYADRSPFMRDYEKQIIEHAPNTVLVLVKATAAVIRRRMANNPHMNGAVQDKDIEHVIQRYDEEYEASHLRHKITVETSEATVEESLAELLGKLKPLLSDADVERFKL